MSTQYRSQSRIEDARFEDLSLNELESITDDDIAQVLKETEQVEKTESIWNLPTFAGITTIVVGIAYMLQYFGLNLMPFALESIVNAFTLFAGLLIMLFGFGVLSWKPKNKNKNSSRTIGKQQSGNTYAPPMTASGKKALYKSVRNKKLAGVCAGIAEYFNLDPTLVRIAFVASMFIFQGVPFFLYIVLGLVLPREEVIPKTQVQEWMNRGRDDNDRIRITRD